MRLMRFGPTIVFLRGDVGELKRKVAELFSTPPVPTDEAIKKSHEFETIIMVTGSGETRTIPAEEGFLIHMGAQVVLAELMNSGLPIEKVQVESTIILLHIPEKLEDALKILAEELKGEIMSQDEALEKGEASDTVVSVTKKKLNSPVGPEDIAGAILVHRDFLSVYRELSIDLPVLLLKLLPEWKEITIKVYDTDKRYEENIERLLLVIEDLDIGFVVGEGWDWDYPRPFMRVPVYKLKLLTWEDPVRVKFLLKGLEYRGYKRFCDIDVFVGKKKIDWVELGKFDSKFELGKAAREELEKQLSEDVRRKLHEIEEKLLGESDEKAETKAS